MTVHETSPETGTLLTERYRIEKLLGEGGMGQVYLVTDTFLNDEKVALKLLHADLCEDEMHVKRFIREVQLTRKITHANIVRTFDVGTSDGRLFFTMEYVEGETLSELLEEGQVDSYKAAEIVKEITLGLEAIRNVGIIHRDLKPGNVIITQEGTVKITDFGVARPQMSELTAHNEVIGSAAYMAPELWSGKDIDIRSDIYALGIIAYEMLVGELPFDAESPAELMCKHLELRPIPPIDRVSNTPLWFNILVMKMLEKDPNRRPQLPLDISQRIDEKIARSTATFKVPEDLKAAIRAEMDAPQIEKALNSAPDNLEDDLSKHMPPKVEIIEVDDDDWNDLATSSYIRRIAPDSGTKANSSSYKKQVHMAQQRTAMIQNEALKASKAEAASPHQSSSVLSALVKVALIFLASSFILYGLVGPATTLAKGWWALAPMSQSTLGFVMLFTVPIVMFSLTMSMPVFMMALFRRSVASSIRIWLQMTANTLLLSFIVFGYFSLRLATTAVGTSFDFTKSKMLTVMYPSLQNVFEAALLMPQGTFYRATWKMGVPEYIESGASDFMVIFPYYLILALFLYTLARTIIRKVLSYTNVERASYFKVIIFVVGLPVVAEVGLRKVLGDTIGWYYNETTNIALGPFLFNVDIYSAGCAVINWILLVSVLSIAFYHRKQMKKQYIASRSGAFVRN